MRLALVVSVVLIGVMLAPLVPTTEAQGWEALAIAIGKKLTTLWNSGNLTILGHKCTYSVRPTINRFQLYFKGKMWCPGWTAIRGEARTRSRSGVLGKTATDFARKAFNAGLITEQHAKEWLKP
ncbi:hypothetical protein SK128_006490 [Halocaridina rubra]|uniref:Anti-lipopolysaccharide factor n=1 Tax=Halocaridina rubra TaxID=373956 RepID=A0AAN9AHI0_HALRR